MKFWISILLLLSIAAKAHSQCECETCPVDIISNQTTFSSLEITGAVNDQLGQNGQHLCQICINFVHDAVEEIDVFLFSPSGSNVQLIENTGLSVNDNITFDICFVACSQQAQPDPGFPAVFDSDAGWLDNQTYTGSYYPFDPACLEGLSGDVNGTWTLQTTDNVGLDDGTVITWYLVFADDTGIGCPNADDCGEPCLADAGVVSIPPDTFCVGDPALATNFTPFYDGVTNIEPPAAEYGYTYIVYETMLDAPILLIDPNPDLTGFPPGTYAICGLSYLLADEPLLPVPNGTYNRDDLLDQIAAGDFCADLMLICQIRTIEGFPVVPDFTGPTEVCIGDPVDYLLNNLEPEYEFFFTVNQGGISQYVENADGVTVAWISGPAQLCASYYTGCDTLETCIDIEVLDEINPVINGDVTACAGDIISYLITPVPQPPEFYSYSVTGGNIIAQTNNTIDIEWVDPDIPGELCVEYNGALCQAQPVCIDIDIQDPEVLACCACRRDSSVPGRNRNGICT